MEKNMKPTSTATKPTERPARLFHRANYLLFLLSALLLLAGYALMAGTSTTAEAYEPDIFSPRRTAVAPMITLAGYIILIVGILWRRKPTARCR